MSQYLSLCNQFLIAMPGLADPNFFHAVTYICEHSEEGTMGIVINHPMEISVKDLLAHIDITTDIPALETQRVLAGGPIQQERGFVLHRAGGQWESSLETSNELMVTTSQDILAAIANGDGPEESLITLGYAGWEAGQLEEELSSNTWLTVPANTDIIFQLPYVERWRAAAKALGVDIDKLSDDVGHA